MWSQRKPIIAEIEKKRGSRFICYLTSDRLNATAIIAKDALPIFFNQLRQFDGLKRLDVLIFTVGGDTLAAFGLGRMVREFASWVEVLVPDRCHSAGTLFSLSADQIFMTRAGTLSPIDPSITTPLNPLTKVVIPGVPQQLVPVSVESVAGFRSLLKEWSIEKEENVVAAFKILAEQIHPLALGDVYRSRQQIERLAQKLMSAHRHDDDEVKKIVGTLTRELGSHDYPISKSEARQLMTKQIAEDDTELEDMVWKLFQDFSKDMQLGVPYNPAAVLQSQGQAAHGQTRTVKLSQNLANIESLKSRDVFEQEVLLSEVQTVGPMGPIKGVQQEVANSGWRHYT